MIKGKNYVRLYTTKDKFEIHNIPKKSVEPICTSLKKLLETQPKSYYNVALSINISPTQIYKYLQGKIKLPSQQHLELLAKTLEVKPEYFAEYRIHKITNYLLDNLDIIDKIIKKYM